MRGDLEHAHALVADEVVRTAQRRVRERRDDALGEVLDVDELPRLVAVAVDAQSGSPASARATKRATTVDARAPGPCGMPKRRMVGVNPYMRGVRAAVHLACELGRRVEVVGRHEQRVLVERLALPGALPYTQIVLP